MILKRCARLFNKDALLGLSTPGTTGHPVLDKAPPFKAEEEDPPT
jgi:hypothetical protein